MFKKGGVRDMQITRTELKNIEALHVSTKMPVYIYDFQLKLLKIYNSAKRYHITYDFTKIDPDSSADNKHSDIWYEYGVFKEIFIFLPFKDVIITVGPFLTNHMDQEDMDVLMNSHRMMSQSITKKKEWLEYYESMPIYALGDIRDFIILLGTILGIDLESAYSDNLHTEVYKNEWEIKNTYLNPSSINDIQSEKNAFYYENQILELVVKGDLKVLRREITDLKCGVSSTWCSNSIRSEKNYTIVILEKLSSLVLRIGKDVMETIHLRDFYIKKVEQQENLLEVLAVRDSAIIHFTKELHDLENSVYSPFILSVIQYINLKIYDPYKISDLAKHFFVSESTLRRQFKSEVGVNISEYTNKKKIAISKIFLTDGMPITECSKRLGFFDSSHFYRTFKKYEGVTPKQFLKMPVQFLYDEIDFLNDKTI